MGTFFVELQIYEKIQNLKQEMHSTEGRGHLIQPTKHNSLLFFASNYIFPNLVIFFNLLLFLQFIGNFSKTN